MGTLFPSVNEQGLAILSGILRFSRVKRQFMNRIRECCMKSRTDLRIAQARISAPPSGMGEAGAKK